MNSVFLLPYTHKMGAERSCIEKCMYYDFISAHMIQRQSTVPEANIKSLFAIRWEGGNFAPRLSLAICLSSSHGNMICKMSGSMKPISLIT